MSSEEWIGKKRCVIKKLDFEHCVMTNANARLNVNKRHKTRAKASRELRTTKNVQPCVFRGENSPVLCAKSVKTAESPVLVKRKLHLSASPVLRCQTAKSQTQLSRNQIQKRFKQVTRSVEDPPSQDIEAPSSPGHNSQDLFASQQEVLSRVDGSQYKIECERSDEVATSSEKISVNTTSVSSIEIQHSRPTTPVQDGNSMLLQHLGESGKKRKRLKKGSLSARLDILLRRQTSERRIKTHEMETMKSKGNGASETLQVLDVWPETSRLLLQCRNAAAQQVVLVLDRPAAHAVGTNIMKGSRITITPPWQKVRLENRVPPIDVLLSVGSVEVECVSSSSSCAGVSDVSTGQDLVVPEPEEFFDDLYLGHCLFPWTTTHL